MPNNAHYAYELNKLVRDMCAKTGVRFKITRQSSNHPRYLFFCQEKAIAEVTVAGTPGGQNALRRYGSKIYNALNDAGIEVSHPFGSAKKTEAALQREAVERDLAKIEKRIEKRRERKQWRKDKSASDCKL